MAAAPAHRRRSPPAGPARHRRGEPRRGDLRADGRDGREAGARREGDRRAEPLDRRTGRGAGDPDDPGDGVVAQGRTATGHLLRLPRPHGAPAPGGVPHGGVLRGRPAQPRDHPAAAHRRRTPRPGQRPVARTAGPCARADPRRLHRGPLVRAAGRESTARRARAARARREEGDAGLAGQGAHHSGRARGGGRRRLPHRHPAGRAARPGRWYDGLRQVRAAADPDRLAGGRQPARRVQLRARRLQGRRGVQGLQPPAAHRRDGHRPRRPPDHPCPGVPGCGAPPARAPAGRRRREGHRGLPGRSHCRRRADAAAADRHRRVRGACRRAAGLRHRPGRRGATRPFARRTPHPGDAAPRRRGQRGDQVQHQPAHRASRHGRGRLRRRDRVVRRRADLQVLPRPRLRATRALLADPVPELAGRRASRRRRGRRRTHRGDGLGRPAAARTHRRSGRRRRGRRQRGDRPGRPGACDQRRQR